LQIWVQKPKARIPLLIAAVVVPVLMVWLCILYRPSISAFHRYLPGVNTALTPFVSMSGNPLCVCSRQLVARHRRCNQAFSTGLWSLHCAVVLTALVLTASLLEIAVETGIGGLLIFAGLLVGVLRGSSGFLQEKDISSRGLLQVLALDCCMMAQGCGTPFFIVLRYNLSSGY